MTAPRAWVGRRRTIIGAALVLLVLAGWAVRHAMSTVAAFEGRGSRFGVVYTLAFALLCWQALLSFAEPTRRVTPRRQRQLDGLDVAVIVPVYNEDGEALRAGLHSLLTQSRRPQRIVVVDDGSTKVDYGSVRRWFLAECAAAGVDADWVRKANGGKRSAQGEAVQRTPTADIYLTVDSDAVLDAEALREGLKPFVDRRVQSVAGVVLALNNHKRVRAGGPRRWLPNLGADLLCRLTDLWFVAGQLVDRSAMSTMGSVLVNSGPLALYRARVLRDNLDGYLNETFFGRRVEFSDDSMLTLYALRCGRAVQQPTAFAFTLMPETFGQHRRQYMRWMRGAFIRTWWRFRYLPLSSYAYWGHLVAWAQMLLSTVIFVALFVVAPARSPEYLPAWPWLLVVPVLVGYGHAVRYLSVRRSDQSTASQLLTFALCPLAALYAFFVLRAMRWWAMATPLKTGWGTRQSVEVRLDDHGRDAPTMEIPLVRAISLGSSAG